MRLDMNAILNSRKSGGLIGSKALTKKLVTQKSVEVLGGGSRNVRPTQASRENSAANGRY